ncbi:MAG: hypothetical protein U0U66_11815 [Cytophagaceae bacterium]
MKYKIIYFLLFLTVTLSCKKDNVNPISISVRPDYLYMDADMEEVIPFTVSVKGPSKLTRFIIQYQQSGGALITLKDSSLNTSTSLYYAFNYTLPVATNSYETTLYFYCYDNEGGTASTSRTFRVSGSNTPATETSGVKLYSASSGNTDGYNLNSGVYLQTSSAPSDSIDIRDVVNTSLTDVLSRSITSSNNVKFVVFNSFNYANATSQSIRNAFTNGVSLSQVNNINAGTILIAEINRLGVKSYYAISIVSVNDDSGAANDFYLINYKK